MLRCLAFLCFFCFLTFGDAVTCAQESKPAAEQPSIAGDPKKHQTTPEKRSCSETAAGLEHSDALQNFCEWVLSFDAKLPNIIGDEDTSRYSLKNGKEYRLVDTTGARIAYVDGNTQYSDLMINHVKIKVVGDPADDPNLRGSWSFGEYGSDLRWLFGKARTVHFRYAGEDSLRGSPVLVFTYEVYRADNDYWYLRARVHGRSLQETYPGYRGRILLDKKTFQLERFEKESTDIDPHFPVTYASKTTEHQFLPLGDGTSFVLPTQSVTMMCSDKKRKQCNVNHTTFRNWQKFAAKSRILTDIQPK
jgi:hypothetical protein